MIRRQIKLDDNNDRLFDFVKCREIKKWKQKILREQEGNKNDSLSDHEQDQENMQEDVKHLSQQIIDKKS